MSLQNHPWPPAFLWGAATSAFQVEGAADADGRGPSIWDAFCGTPGRLPGGPTSVAACEHYHRFNEDIALMSRLGLNAYRFSISWPRVMPDGAGQVNPAGLDFYDRLVDALRRANIEPLVTLYHWDLPAALQERFGGWAHADSPHIFADYAELVLRRLGDRVRWWLTLNEPWVVVDAGYFHGVHPPGLKDRRLGYRVGHNLLRAHAYSVARFRAMRRPDAQISFALNTAYFFPAGEGPDDAAAAERSLLNFGGWFMDPVQFGDYPQELRARLGDLLPEFTPEDSRLLTRSADFLALNYYTSDIVRHAPSCGPMEAEILAAADVPRTAMNWKIMPDGLRRLLHWLWDRYRLPICITENGAAFDDAADEGGFVRDTDRLEYIRTHLEAVAAAMRDGVDLRGYFVWSLLDNLEWAEGYSKRFGIVRCDFATQQRTIKASGQWYAEFLAAIGARPHAEAIR